MGRRPAGRVLAAALVVIVGCAGTDPTIRGEIDDTAIRLAQERGPDSVWVKLTNVGTGPCELVAMWTELPPDALPVRDGRVVMSLSGAPDVVTPLEGSTEVNGEPVARDGSLTEEGLVTVVRPGDIARLQTGFKGTPDGVRIFACNGPGDYEAGRYAVLGFEG